MKVQAILPVVAATLAVAQNSDKTPTLAEALASKNDTLSVLNGALTGFEIYLDSLSPDGMTGLTDA